MNKLEELKSQAISGAKWNAIAQVLKIGFYFITTAILARLLLPSDFGVLGLATIFTSLVAIFNDFGLGSSVIQQKEVDDDFLSTVFWASLGVGFISFCITFLLAPVISIFFENPAVNQLLKGLSITFLLTALAVVPQSIAMKRLEFKKVMVIESSSMILGSIAAVVTALLNFGLWAFVFQGIITNLAVSLGYWISTSYRPHIRFNGKQFVRIIKFSSGLFGFNFVNFFSRNSDNFLIGKFLGATSLGIYSIAYKVMQYPVQNITSVINRVLFPTLSQVSDDNARFCRGYIQASQIITAALFPLLGGVLCLAEEFTMVLFGAKWTDAIPVIRILVSAGILQTIGGMIGVIYTAKGETKKFFYWGLFSSIIAVAFIVLGLRWGILGVALFYSIATVILFLPSLVIPFRFIGLSLSRYFRELVTPALLSGFMCLIVISTKVIEKNLGLSRLLILVTSVIIGGFFYVFASLKFNKPTMDQFRRLIGFDASNSKTEG